MNKDGFSKPIDLHHIRVTDPFWSKEMKLVRKEVIPYQWEILNDRVPDAAPSYCMHNFKVAGRMMREKKKLGKDYKEPKYTFRGFESLPEDPRKPSDDAFYGFVFQDSDFAKWIEAVGYSLIDHPDAELERIADGAIDIVCEAQQENGYLDTYYIINGMDRIFTNLRDHHELYCFGHLAEGAVSYYQATGKDKLLKAACRYADFIADYFGPEEGKCKGYPGHEIAEMALYRLYEVTGEEKYSKLAEFFLNERGKQPFYFEQEHPKGEGGLPTNNAYHQAHLPVREQREATGHAVRAVYLYSGMADMARLTEDEQMFEACEKLWNNIVKEKMYITGGIGATHLGEAFSFSFDLPNDTAYAETCASIGLVFFASRMLQIKADSRYSDVMEQALYNGILSGMALDGKSFFYVNPLEVDPIACHKDERKAHVKPVRQKWFGCACCPPNLARLITSIGRYAYTESANSLYLHLYLGGVIEKEVDGELLKLHVESGLPYEGSVRIRMECEKPVYLKLAMRIPGWTKGDVRIVKSVGGTVCEVTKEAVNGYIYLEEEYHNDDEIIMGMDMRPVIIAANSRVKEDEGRVAFMRGPMVFCAEEVDNGKGLHRLRVNPGSVIREEKLHLYGTDAICLKTKGTRRAEDETGDLYHPYRIPETEETEIMLIPYYLWANRGEGEMSVFLRCD